MDYDPFKNRVDANLTYFDAFVNMLKCVFGTGVLATPMVFQKIGYYGGLIVTFVTVFVMTYAVHVLVRAMNETCRRHQVPYLPFDKAMVMGFLEGPPIIHPLRYVFEFLVKLFLLIFYFGIGSAFIIFIADGINKILEIHYKPVDVRTIVMALVIPITIIFFIRNLKQMVPFSFTANVLLFSAYYIIIYFVVQDLPPLSERRKFNDINGIPFSIGALLFASSSLGVFLAVESKMIKPWRFISCFGVLNMSMIINYLVISGFGFVGYWKYGDEIKPTIQLNIASEDIVSQCVNIFLITSIYMTYTLQCSVIIDILWINGISSRFSPKRQLFYEIILRFLIVIVTSSCGLILPHFDMIIALTGSVTVTIVSICFPAILDMCLRYKSGFGPMKIYFFRDIFLIVVGLMGFASGIMMVIHQVE